MKKLINEAQTCGAIANASLMVELTPPFLGGVTTSGNPNGRSPVAALPAMAGRCGMCFTFILVIFFLFAQQNFIFAEENKLEINGSYKNLWTTTQSRTSQENFYADLNRLRLEFKQQMDPWSFYLTLDNDAIINDFANTADFELIRSKTQEKLTSADLDKVSVDNDHLYLKHSIHRAYVKYYQEKFQATIGKQSIDWGKMRFYSPLDVFNTLSPIDLDKDNRLGIDALNFNFSPEAFSGMNMVLAPGENYEKTSLGLNLTKKVSTYDLALIFASIKKDEVLGLSFDGYLKDMGLRGEISQTRQDSHKDFLRISLGADYNFTDKIYALLEHFFNGGHDDNDLSALTTSYRALQKILSLKKHLTSFFLKITLTPLIQLNHSVIYDWDGKSTVYNPEMRYNIITNVDLAVGVQLFFGGDNSEFGDYEHLYYAELKWFF